MRPALKTSHYLCSVVESQYRVTDYNSCLINNDSISKSRYGLKGVRKTRPQIRGMTSFKRRAHNIVFSKLKRTAAGYE